MTPPPPPSVSDSVFYRAVWFNTFVLAAIVGTGGGLAFSAITVLSLMINGSHAGTYLNLLGAFLPGYRVSPAGVLIGGFWVFMLAAISAALVYQIYARSIRGDLASRLDFDPTASRVTSQLIMRLAPRRCGVAVGGIFALQIVLSTCFLVAGGSKVFKTHAALLAFYLPGYSVSYLGALCGGAWGFAYAFLLSWLFATVYNGVTDQCLRSTRSKSLSM